MLLAPLLTSAEQADAQLAKAGHAVLSAEATCELVPCRVAELSAWADFWTRLPADAFLRDGGRYRRRRHSCFIVEGDLVRQVPHRPHWQPLEYNALHGGLERLFEPLEPGLIAHACWAPWLRALARRASALKGERPWFVEAHPFRIDTTDGIGRPTPEGAHRDGVDLVAVTLISRVDVKGAETRVFAAEGREGQRFTLTEPFSTLLLDDERVIHESTPIQPLNPAQAGHRDSLVITLRAGAFQGPVPGSQPEERRD
jgi:hypothetical protein